MSSVAAVPQARVHEVSSTPTWWVVFLRELQELWMGGKAPILLLLFTIMLGVLTYVMASNSELSLIPPQEMVYETLKGAFAFALFMCLIIGADSISGERERSTLESLLLTPTSRRQIVFGKFLAGVSPWPVAMAITIPYMYAISQGNEVFPPAVIWGAILGSVMVPAFVAIGMLASFWSSSNKTSLFVSLGIFILFFVPKTLPGRAQTGKMGALLQQVNPMAATEHFWSKILVNNRTFGEWWGWTVAPVVLALVAYAILFLYAAPGLRLEGGSSSKMVRAWGRLIGSRVFLIGALLAAALPGVAMAQTAPAQDSVAQAAPAVTGSGHAPHHSIGVTIDMDYRTVRAGEHILYTSVVTNHGGESSPPLCVAMNIVNLNAAGDIVDPEDWSPQRTQYIETVAPGDSDSLTWRINAILDGDYLIYMVVIPEPTGPDATSQPVASSGIHLTVTKYTKLNPAGILPYAIGGPALLAIGMVYIMRRRRRQIDDGGAA